MPDDALEGVKILYRLARNAHGGKIMPRHPGLITTTDETTIFIFAGVLNRKKQLELTLVAEEALKEANVRSCYDLEVDERALRGLRVKHIMTHCALGLSAVPYIIVSGLTEEQLPKELTPSGFLSLKVEGLIGGGIKGARSPCHGFVVFTRSDGTDSVGAEKIGHYLKNVFIPFGNDTRRYNWFCAQYNATAIG
jgi:hypothetical protein